MAFLKNTIFYTIGNLLPKVSAFFLLPVYANYLGTKEFGIAESMAIVSSILAVLFSLGIHNSVYRLYYDYKTDEEQAIFFGTVNIAMVSLAIFSTIILLIFRNSVSDLFKSIPFYPYFLYSILFSLINNLGELPKAYLMIKEKALQYSLIGLSQFFCTTLCIIWFVVVRKEGAEGMLKGQVIGSAFVLPYLLGFAIRNFKFKFDRRIFKNILLFSLPAIPTIVAAWILNLSDRVFIERYLSVNDVGIYSLGYRIAGVIGFLFGAIEMAYMPYFFKLANSQEKRSISKISIINQVYTILLLFITFSIALFSKELIELFFTIEFRNSFIVAMIVSYVYFFTQIGAILSKNLSQSKKVKQGMFIDIGCALLNILLNFLLIPYLGIYGAAWATLISFIASTYVYYIYSSRYTFFVPINIKLSIVSLLVSIVFLIIFNILITLDWIYLVLLKSIFIGIVLILGYIYYLRHKKMLHLMFFNRND
jgi:O-antigen/teichoic acid export membrane protein